jgi:hypothetical protein
MSMRPVIFLYAVLAMGVGVLLCPRPAAAQFLARQVEDPATGERYHIEAAAGFWFPGAYITLSSAGTGALAGLIGTTVDAKTDLGLTDQHFPEVHLVARPSKTSKFRFQYIPIRYEQTGLPTRDIVFNGQRYRAQLPVSSSVDWKAYRLGYEFDFVSRDRGYGGFILDIKYTDVSATLSTPLTAPEFSHARLPIPALGGIFRVYPVPNISITGEITGFKLPDNLIKDVQGHYIDVDFYGTLNFTNNLGAQVGYRSFDVLYSLRSDAGAFVLKGLYFGVVARY